MPGRTQILKQEAGGAGWELAIRRPPPFLAPRISCARSWQFTGVPPTEARGMLIDLAAFQSEVNSVQDGTAGAP
jgi:hypothetical protein